LFSFPGDLLFIIDKQPSEGGVILMIIGITGATGQLGRLIIQKLKEKTSAQVLALARSPQKAADLGVPIHEADYGKPETLDEALFGIDILLLISSNALGKRIVQHRNVIEAAKNNNIKWIVYTSILHADTTPLHFAYEDSKTEAAIIRSGLPYTILRNGWYTEMYTNSIPGALARGAFTGCAGYGRISSATRLDYAEAAVAVLTSGGHHGQIYELAGDTAYTLFDLAAEVSRQTGKNIPYTNLSIQEYAAVLKNSGVPDDRAYSIAGFDASASQDALFDDSGHLSRLIGRPTTPLSEAVAEALKRN
jgi:NAD(P)H dehydrogenase (quinone)